MLVLTRRAGETVVIDGAVYVTVVAVKGDRVRLGVTAPQSVQVDRSEVYERRRASGSGSPPFSISSASQGESSMQTAQLGDRVQVHYVKFLQGGTVASSRGHAPLELTVGLGHPRLPGLGLALVGLAPGTSTKLAVPAEQAYGLHDPTRVRRLAHSRFPKDQPLRIGKWVRILNRQGRRRLVRVLEVRSKTVVVDTNHRWAGQALELEVELIGIQARDDGSDFREP